MIAWNTQNININTDTGRTEKRDFQKNGRSVYNVQNDVVYVRGAQYNLPPKYRW